jgi:hypothetical protein
MLFTTGLAKHGEIGGGNSRDYGVISANQGNRADYLTARIARDRPDILRCVQAIDRLKVAGRPEKLAGDQANFGKSAS